MNLTALTAALLVAAPGQAAGAEALAVLPVSEPPGPDAALVEFADELRASLAARGAVALSPEALRGKMTGTAPASALTAADITYQGALDAHAAGDFEGSIRTLRALVADLEALPGAAAHERWCRAMLRLARSEQAVGRLGESEAVLRRLLRAQPDLPVDPRLYPPGFQRLVENVRTVLRALSTRRLTVESRPGVRVLIEGREAGEAPLTLQLPPGRYRVSGVLGSIRSRQVVVDVSSEDRRVELDLTLAELLQPAGPSLVVPRAERAERIPPVARFLDLDRLVTASIEVRRDRRYLAATIHDARRGTSEAEGRVYLPGGKLPAGGADALASFLLTGEASPLVEVAPALADLDAVLPPLGPRGNIFTWDGEKRPGARKYGWIAAGSGVAAVALTAIAVTGSRAARDAYSDARGMQDGEGGVSYGHTTAEYNAAIRRGDRARNLARGAGIGAGVFAASTVVFGLVSYHRTGEIGPIRF